VLADGDKYTEHQLDTLIRYQEAIEAIDRAIKPEDSERTWNYDAANALATRR
jgi:regulator of PEP synthase PpsR (kinase-PPPase family)